MIEIKNISFSYGKSQILRDVSFAAQDSECVGILGNNGAGKSTLITCINRIRIPEAGEVLIDGKSVQSMSRNEMARTIAYVAQKNEMMRLRCLTVCYWEENHISSGELAKRIWICARP